MCFLKPQKEKKMEDSNKTKDGNALQEIAAILAAGIIRMKKKGKLK